MVCEEICINCKRPYGKIIPMLVVKELQLWLLLLDCDTHIVGNGQMPHEQKQIIVQQCSQIHDEALQSLRIYVFSFLSPPLAESRPCKIHLHFFPCVVSSAQFYHSQGHSILIFYFSSLKRFILNLISLNIFVSLSTFTHAFNSRALTIKSKILFDTKSNHHALT